MKALLGHGVTTSKLPGWGRKLFKDCVVFKYKAVGIFQEQENGKKFYGEDIALKMFSGI